ncbi:unnamed protein product [Polarella glacialis]|uniref:Glutathione transferase n=1 Tax=Polarella glacialis TaxID=89957 RepID=A0A813K6Y5_POLGL|nr:unnamed protein product [Polarella glacialis]
MADDSLNSVSLERFIIAGIECEPGLHGAYEPERSALPPTSGWTPTVCALPSEVPQLTPEQGTSDGTGNNNNQQASDGTPNYEGMEPPPSVPLVLWWSKTCPYVQRVSIALLEKGLDAQHRQAADIHGGLEDAFLAAFQRACPDRQRRPAIPVLEHRREQADGEGEASAPGSIALIGSQVIVEYLDEEFGGAGRRLLPACAAERAQARLFLQAFERALMPCEAELLAARRQDEFVAASGRLDDALKTLEAALTMYSVGLGPFLIGEYFGFVEVLCAPFLQRLVTLLPLLRNISVIERTIGLSRLSSWVAAVVGRPSVVATYDLEAVAEVMLRAVTTLEEKESSAELRARARAFLPYSTLC